MARILSSSAIWACASAIALCGSLQLVFGKAGAMMGSAHSRIVTWRLLTSCRHLFVGCCARPAGGGTWVKETSWAEGVRGSWDSKHSRQAHT